jgi:hypothetical protein
MPGPLPSPTRRRRNAPTIPTTELPASGRKGPIPKPPSWVELGKEGMAWWRWAWRTPESAAWSPGQLAVVARRASLEDDLAATEAVEGLDLLDVLELESLADVRKLVQRLASLVTGRLQIQRAMLDIDDRLGLTTKGSAALRFKIVADEETCPADAPTSGNGPSAESDTGAAVLTLLKRPS